MLDLLYIFFAIKTNIFLQYLQLGVAHMLKTNSLTPGKH